MATIQTDTRFADRVYLLPVTPQYVESVIEKERPDAIMLSYGGQTALNCGVGLAEGGVLDKYGVQVLGTDIGGIRTAEDRQLFKDAMGRCGVPVLPSETVTDFEAAKRTARKLGYPVIVRVAYTLGGKGGGVARNELELHEIVERGIKASMVGQVLIEEYIGGWKQIEYEVMRDTAGNGVIVCNMENILAMKVHTGDNIVVAPSQTINNREYHMLRSASLRAASHVGIVGECNVQFALDTASEKYVAIEMNPRLSRSSALASKATGYPLAYMSAKIGLGYDLHELTNTITKSTTACFEPSLDYVVCKHPRWDFAKFDLVERKLGPTMKSVGEVMGVGRTFEESLQKAIRMLDSGLDGLVLNRFDPERYTEEELEERLIHFDDTILYNVAAAVSRGFDTARISRLSSIDPWFVEKIRSIVETAGRLKSEPDRPTMREAKAAGFSDVQIGRACGRTAAQIRAARKGMGILPRVKQIDSLAAEWPAATNYLYMTYGGTDHDVAVPAGERAAMVLGAGPYRIGSSVEFDWGTVNMVWGIREHDIPVAVVNCNPETVSTDYDICNRLYFEELTHERVMDIVEFESPRGVVTSVGGQAANNLTPSLAASGVPILGTSATDVDRAEDRSKFSAELDKLHIRQPRWQAFSSLEGARTFARDVGFPVLVRPSYVLSGAAMKVVWSADELETYTQDATRGLAGPPRRDIQVHAQLAGGGRGRRLRRRQRHHRGGGRAHRQRRGALGRRDDVHPALEAGQHDGADHHRVHRQDSPHLPHPGALQPAVPGARRGGVRDRAEHTRLPLHAVRLETGGHEPHIAGIPRRHGRQAARRPPRQVARGAHRGDKGAPVLVHAAGGCRPHAGRGDALHRRGGLLRGELL